MIRIDQRLVAALTEEALRLFFPLSAIYAALWPFLWTWLFSLNLPLTRSTPPSVWHGHEMIYGAYGAALLGFILTAVPEWTNQARPSPRFLLALASLWGVGRFVGLLGADWANLLAWLADAAWLGALIVFVASISVRTRRSNLGGFVFWLVILLACEASARWAIFQEDVLLAQTALRSALLAFAALLALALARITPAITNRILDPAQRTTPFRPHPGRRNLAPALIALCIGAQFAGASSAVTGYLLVASGAAFMDRVAESFIGRAFFRLEILALSGAAALAGAGFILMGAGRLGLSGAETAGAHVLGMGGLGLGVLGVFSIAGKLHTGQDLRLSKGMALAFALLLISIALRILPSFGVAPPGPMHGLAALAWAGAFLIWLNLYWPAFSNSD
jgi:uncharacterized protein involved in response to NO